ncbi:MAG: hypothetical protein GTN36_01245 [Candidatus Aenigmarchaeota archaeon]|nr:hypothetical protein [Candidatus Aenigmarchaeota archaeon]
MNQEAEQQKEVEQKEEKPVEKKSEVRINLTRWGKNKKEVLENISFIIILISTALFSIGIGLGSFAQGTIYLSVFGSFFIMVGIVIYIVSQFMRVRNG